MEVSKYLDKNLYWIAIYTMPRAEKQVAQRIQEIPEKNLESYLPLQRKLHKWSDRKKWVEVPLFSSYVFAHVRQRDFYCASHVDGALGAIQFGSRVSIIPDREIEYIKQALEAQKEVFVANEASLKKGVRARIISGPLEGHEGVLVSDCKEGNFAVSISGLNLSVVIDVAKDMLEYLPDDPNDKKGKKKYNF